MMTRKIDLIWCHMKTLYEKDFHDLSWFLNSIKKDILCPSNLSQVTLYFIKKSLSQIGCNLEKESLL